MAARALFLCASALLVQMIAGRCISPASIQYSGCGSSRTGLSSLSVAPTSGGGFLVRSVSPINPNGVSVASENNIEGSLAVTGQLPFVSAVALQGQVPSGGQAGVQYSCGNGNVGITSVGPSNGGVTGINSVSGAIQSRGNPGLNIGNGCGRGGY